VVGVRGTEYERSFILVAVRGREYTAEQRLPILLIDTVESGYYQIK